MGNSSEKIEYNNRSEIHLSELGSIGKHYPWWPNAPYYVITNLQYGQWFCDEIGIPREDEWCKLYDLELAEPLLYVDI